ncbi:MAG TPA: M28 family peptidase [Thermoleophilia bacterium]
METRVWSIMLLGAAALLLLPAAASALTYDQAVDDLLAAGYPQNIEGFLTSQGTSAIGMAFGGSSADTARAEYLAKELKALGFAVTLERVPLDVMEFKGASVSAGGSTYVASTFGGVRGTPPGGITGQLVSVGGGTAAEVAAAGDLAGKIAVIDAKLGSYWMNWPWTEAALAGASGIIYTGIAADDSYYAEPTSLGSFDAEYRYALAPVVYISQTDGMALKAALVVDPTLEATMVNDVETTLVGDGGVGYNVVATLKGSVPGAGRIVIGAHHDAYFHAGLDDTGGVTAGMLMAKAMKMSGYHPKRSVTFLFTTGEEYGRVNSYYDWLIGAWHAITQRHPQWAGSTSLMMNLESMAMNGAKMQTRATPEVRGVIAAAAADRPELVPNGFDIQDVNCWNDQWTFTAAGVPSMYFRARTAEYGSKWYHTDFDTIALMDYDYLAKINKFTFGILRQFDGGLLPYDLSARAADLDGNVDGAALIAAGAKPAVVNDLEAKIATFTTRATAYQARAAKIPAHRRTVANVQLMNVEKRLNRAFTALDVWDTTVYPHVQVQWDLEQLNAALAALAADPVDAGAAKAALEGVGITSPSGFDFSRENYQMQLAMHAPGWSGGLFWGAQGHLSPYLDVIPAWNKVDDGKYAAATASLSVMRDAEVRELNARLNAMTLTLKPVNAILPTIR